MLNDCKLARNIDRGRTRYVSYAWPLVIRSQESGNLRQRLYGPLKIASIQMSGYMYSKPQDGHTGVKIGEQKFQKVAYPTGCENMLRSCGTAKSVTRLASDDDGKCTCVEPATGVMSQKSPDFWACAQPLGRVMFNETRTQRYKRS